MVEMIDITDCTIVKTYDTSDIKHDDYILYDNEVYKIHLIKYQCCRKIYTSVTYKCRDFLETKNEFLKFSLNDTFDEYRKFEKEITKIIFTIKNGTFVDYDHTEELITILDDENNLVDIRCSNNTKRCIGSNDEEIIKYIRYNENYKIIT